MKISHETIKYTENQWGLNCVEYDDTVSMLWGSGFYEEAVWMLVDNGAFSFEPDSAPAKVNQEVKTLYKKMKRVDVDAAIDECLDGDFKAIECKVCGAIELLNSLYWDDLKQWSCHSCGVDGKQKFVA